MEKIAGYIVVRKPYFNNEDLLVGKKLTSNVDGVYYCGIDRLNWVDVDNMYLNNMLKLDQKNVYEKLRSSDNDFLGVRILRSISDAHFFGSLDKEQADKNEIIIVSGNSLNTSKGSMLVDSASVNWLGYDLVLLGGWSLIRHAVFENQQYHLLKVKGINDFGLFDNTNVEEFIDAYNKLANLNVVDPLFDEYPLGVECIRIGRPL
jgi:hypothetical protein